MTGVKVPDRRDAVTVWTASRPASAAAVATLARSLPPAERARARALHGCRRAEFVAGRALVRRRLGRLLGCAPVDVPIVVAPTGRPEVPWPADEGSAGPSVNLSHAGGLIVAAFSRLGPVGVDVEADDRLPRAIGWVCSASERDWLAKLPEPRRRRAFARLWTRKEACVKAAGTGIRTRLSSVHCGAGSAGWWDGVRWRELPLRAGFAAAVAVLLPPSTVEATSFDITGVFDDDYEN
jgi:4'-phosphopantetheinyl transferase